MAFNQWLAPALVLAQYQLVSGLPGDLDGDQEVDGADFLQVQRGNPQLLSSGQDQYGIGTEPLSIATSSRETMTVPEIPAIFSVALAMAIVIAPCRYRPFDHPPSPGISASCPFSEGSDGLL